MPEKFSFARVVSEEKVFWHGAAREFFKNSIVAFTAFTIFSLVTPAHAAILTQEQSVAVLRALDKMTARVEELEVPVNQPLKFGTLMITVRTCRVTPPEEAPESAAFLEISEFKPGEQDLAVFHGWMFASSPALSAMEHPIYDIWLIGCKSPATKSSQP